MQDDAGRVTLMTLHAAKGLEFPVVYIAGVEHNLIPHERAQREGSETDLEEERRLLFVGMTRAEQELYLTQVDDRTLHGSRRATIRSSFLDEIELRVRDCTQRPRSSQAIAPFERLKRHPGQRPDGQPLLMTAADLLKGNHRPAAVPTLYTPGMPVRHPHYGRGTVLEIGTPRRQTFVAEKCPLQPLGTSGAGDATSAE